MALTAAERILDQTHLKKKPAPSAELFQAQTVLRPSVMRGSLARIVPHRARKIGVSRSSSTHSTASLLSAGSSSVAIVAAMRNLAGRRFSATSRYHDSAG